jgi:hypothetical protein
MSARKKMRQDPGQEYHWAAAFRSLVNQTIAEKLTANTDGPLTYCFVRSIGSEAPPVDTPAPLLDATRCKVLRLPTIDLKTMKSMCSYVSLQGDKYKTAAGSMVQSPADADVSESLHQEITAVAVAVLADFVAPELWPVVCQLWPGISMTAGTEKIKLAVAHVSRKPTHSAIDAVVNTPTEPAEFREIVTTPLAVTVFASHGAHQVQGRRSSTAKSDPNCCLGVRLDPIVQLSDTPPPPAMVKLGTVAHAHQVLQVEIAQSVKCQGYETDPANVNISMFLSPPIPGGQVMVDYAAFSVFVQCGHDSTTVSAKLLSYAFRHLSLSGVKGTMPKNAGTPAEFMFVQAFNKTMLETFVGSVQYGSPECFERFLGEVRNASKARTKTHSRVMVCASWHKLVAADYTFNLNIPRLAAVGKAYVNELTALLTRPLEYQEHSDCFEQLSFVATPGAWANTVRVYLGPGRQWGTAKVANVTAVAILNAIQPGCAATAIRSASLDIVCTIVTGTLLSFLDDGSSITVWVVMSVFLSKASKYGITLRSSLWGDVDESGAHPLVAIIVRNASRLGLIPPMYLRSGLVVPSGEHGFTYTLLLAPGSPLALLKLSGSGVHGPAGLVITTVRVHIKLMADEEPPALLAVSLQARGVLWPDFGAGVSTATLLDLCGVNDLKVFRLMRLDEEFVDLRAAAAARSGLGDLAPLLWGKERVLYDYASRPAPLPVGMEAKRVSLSRSAFSGLGYTRCVVSPTLQFINVIKAVPIPIIVNNEIHLAVVYMLFQNASEQYFKLCVAPPESLTDIVRAISPEPRRDARYAQFSAYFIDRFLSAECCAVTHNIRSGPTGAEGILDTSLFGVVDDRTSGGCPFQAKISATVGGQVGESLVTFLNGNNSLVMAVIALAHMSGLNTQFPDIRSSCDTAIATGSHLLNRMCCLPSYSDSVMASANSGAERQNAKNLRGINILLQTAIQDKQSSEKARRIHENALQEHSAAFEELLSVTDMTPPSARSGVISRAREAAAELNAASDSARRLDTLRAS